MATLDTPICPKCGCDHVAAEVTAWADFKDGKPVGFDEEDVAHVVPLPEGDRICRACQHMWKHRRTETDCAVLDWNLSEGSEP